MPEVIYTSFGYVPTTRYIQSIKDTITRVTNLDDLKLVDRQLSLHRDQAAFEANTLNKKETPLVPQPCSREPGHDGPCNGWECDNHQGMIGHKGDQSLDTPLWFSDWLANLFNIGSDRTIRP